MTTVSGGRCELALRERCSDVVAGVAFGTSAVGLALLERIDRAVAATEKVLHHQERAAAGYGHRYGYEILNVC